MNKPISVRLPTQHNREFATLLHLWIEWYSEYLQSHEPRLIVRFEDILIRPDAVLGRIRECLLGPAEEQQPQHQPISTNLSSSSTTFTYLLAPSKWDYVHWKKQQTSLVSSIITYGNGMNRNRNLTRQDHTLAVAALSSGTHGPLSLPWLAWMNSTATVIKVDYAT